MKYQKKAELVDAIQWNGTNTKEVSNFVTDDNTFVYYDRDYKNMYIKVNNDKCIKLHTNDYIIKDEQGVILICKQDKFNEVYCEIQ